MALDGQAGRMRRIDGDDVARRIANNKSIMDAPFLDVGWRDASVSQALVVGVQIVDHQIERRLARFNTVLPDKNQMGRRAKLQDRNIVGFLIWRACRGRS